VEHNEIEKLYKSGRFKQALAALGTCEPSSWSDTLKLKCYRNIGGRKALNLATELHERISSRDVPYPLNTSARNNQLRYIAQIYAEHGEARLACSVLQPLCESSPNVPSLLREYGFALINDGQLDLAEKNVKNAIKLQPKSAKAHAQLARIYCLTGRLESGRHSFSRATTLEPNNPSYLQRLLYWSNYSDRITQQASFQIAKLWARKAYPANQAGTNNYSSVDPDRILKIGFVSPDFCAHANSFFVTPLFEGIDRKRFHITAFSDTRKPDKVTSKIKSLCDEWVESAVRSDRQLALKIAEQQIDVLIDLNGHSSGNRLGVFASHEAPAPVQASWLGYPSTTGLRCIAHRISDRIADPVGLNDEFFSENIVRLPNGFLCFKPLASSPDINPFDNEDGLRFGSFSNLAKISGTTLDCWAAAMNAVPDSTLYLKRQQLVNRSAMRHIAKQLAARGVSPRRLIFKAAKPTIEDHLAEYNKVDIALDTSPYNGTTTTLEALWMGVPVISLTGDTHASRITASILHRLNLNDLATKSVEEFAECAHRLSANEEQRRELRSNLRTRMQDSSLTNTDQFGYEFGNAIRGLWRDWCRQAKNSPTTPVALKGDQLAGLEE